MATATCLGGLSLPIVASEELKRFDEGAAEPSFGVIACLGNKLPQLSLVVIPVHDLERSLPLATSSFKVTARRATYPIADPSSLPFHNCSWRPSGLRAGIRSSSFDSHLQTLVVAACNDTATVLCIKREHDRPYPRSTIGLSTSISDLPCSLLLALAPVQGRRLGATHANS